MKKITAIILSILCIITAALTVAGAEGETLPVSVWDGVAVKQFASGTGTEADPYLISSAAELDLLATDVAAGVNYEGKFFKLTTNIDWAGKEWVQIGKTSTNCFSGSFDGDGHVVYNFEIFGNNVGFFGVIVNATVKNLGVDYASIETQSRYAGAICGLAKNSTISGCYAGKEVSVSNDFVTDKSAHIGGIAGSVLDKTVMTGCAFNGKVVCQYVQDTAFIGGVVGVIGSGSKVIACINNGSVSADTESTVNGKVSSVGGVAGCIGASSGTGALENCINTGAVSGKYNVGGVLGKVHVADSEMTSCFSTGSVKGGEAQTGAVIGHIGKSFKVSTSAGVGTVAVGYVSDGVTYDATALTMGAAASNIDSTPDYMLAESEILAVTKTFPTVTPVKPAETTLPETEPEPTKPADTEGNTTTEAPEVDATTELTPESTPVGTEATAPVTGEEPADGCGSALAGVITVLSVIGGAMLIKRRA